jgi:hypothetical protein
MANEPIRDAEQILGNPRVECNLAHQDKERDNRKSIVDKNMIEIEGKKVQSCLDINDTGEAYKADETHSKADFKSDGE